jgi:hypothetical protein
MAHKNRKNRSSAEDLAAELKLNNQLKAIVFNAIADARDKGAFIQIPLPWRLIKELAELEQRRSEERDQN